MAKTTFESVQDGAIEVAEQKLKEYWKIVQTASGSKVDEPTAEQFNDMAHQLVISEKHEFKTPDGKVTSYDAIKKEAHDLLKDAQIPEAQKQEFYSQLSADIPSPAQLARVANAAEDTAEEYDNWMTKLQYGAKGFFKMMQEEGFFAAIGEFISSLFSGDFSFGQIGKYGKEIAAQDIQNDVQHRLTELSRQPGMEGVLNAETIGKIGDAARDKVINGDASEVGTTAEQRLKNVKTLELEDMAEKGIESMVDAKLGNRNKDISYDEFKTKFKDGIEGAKKGHSYFSKKYWALNSVKDEDIEKISDVIREPLKELLTSDKLDTSSPEALKSQVVALVKDRLKNDETTGKWLIIQNQEGLDMVANSIADEVTKNQPMLAKAHEYMSKNKPNPLKALDINGDGILEISELGKDANNNDRLEQSELVKMSAEQKAQFATLLAQDANKKADESKKNSQGETVTEINLAALPQHANGAKGFQIGK